MVLPEWDYSIVPCLTLNPPVVPSPRRGRHHVSLLIFYHFFSYFLPSLIFLAEDNNRNSQRQEIRRIVRFET